MAGLFFTLVLGYLLLPIVAIVWAYGSRQRIDQLAADIAQLRRQGGPLPQNQSPAPAETPKPQTPPAPEAAGIMPVPPNPFAAMPPAPAQARHPETLRTETSYSAGARAAEQDDAVGRVLRWLGENWMLAVGALFVFLSVSWLLRYAIIEDILTAGMRIGAGFALGLCVAALGCWRMKNAPQQGAVFLVLGAGAVLLTFFAAREIYGFFTPAIALFGAFATAAFVTYQAMRARLPALSYAGLLAAMLAPMVTKAPDPSFAGLFGYLAVVLAATLWVVLLTGWRKNILLALFMLVLYSIPYWEKSMALPSAAAGLATAYAFAAAFFIADMVGHFRAVRNSWADIMMPLLMAFFLVCWTGVAAEEGARALWLLLWALAFAAGSAVLSRRTGAHYVFYTYMTVAAVLVVTTTAIEFRGAALVVMLMMQAVALTLLCRYVLKSRAGTTAAAFTTLIPLTLGLESLARAHWQGGIWHEHALVLAVLGAAPLLLAWHFNTSRFRYPPPASAGGGAADDAADDAPHLAEICFWVISGSLYSYALVWRGVHALMQGADFATAVCMIVYSVIGIGAYMLGHRRALPYVRRYGAGLLALVIARLLLVDLPEMPVAARIVMFFGVGVLLLATAFVKYRRKEDGGAG